MYKRHHKLYHVMYRTAPQTLSCQINFRSGFAESFDTLVTFEEKAMKFLDEGYIAAVGET